MGEHTVVAHAPQYSWFTAIKNTKVELVFTRFNGVDCLANVAYTMHKNFTRLPKRQRKGGLRIVYIHHHNAGRRYGDIGKLVNHD